MLPGMRLYRLAVKRHTTNNADMRNAELIIEVSSTADDFEKDSLRLRCCQSWSRRQLRRHICTMRKRARGRWRGAAYDTATIRAGRAYSRPDLAEKHKAHYCLLYERYHAPRCFKISLFCLYVSVTHFVLQEMLLLMMTHTPLLMPVR